ncbi:MAG: hypothetical protein CBB70_06920 [Planctomycetaceae bacterium TMED10]|nr:MAG: hypothetical protein CBB70_06920 [Planctomycetaceae bacterium TMED10]
MHDDRARMSYEMNHQQLADTHHPTTENEQPLQSACLLPCPAPQVEISKSLLSSVAMLRLLLF